MYDYINNDSTVQVSLGVLPPSTSTYVPTPTPPPDGGEGTDSNAENTEQEEQPSEEAPKEEEEPGMWEETFKTHHDSKPYGWHVHITHLVRHLTPKTRHLRPFISGC